MNALLCNQNWPLASFSLHSPLQLPDTKKKTEVRSWVQEKPFQNNRWGNKKNNKSSQNSEIHKKKMKDQFWMMLSLFNKFTSLLLWNNVARFVTQNDTDEKSMEGQCFQQAATV